MIRFFPAVAATLLVCPMFACSTNSGDPSQSVSHNADDAEPAPQEPQTLPITQPNRDTDISAIQNDAFALGDVSIEGDTLLITVSYGGGAEAHDFALYWNGMTMRSYPGQINVMLKHNAHGDAAEAYLTQTLRFDLSDLNQPLVLHIFGHGEDDRQTVQYGER